MSDSILSSAVVILVEPQDPVNIGGTVRAMKNMGVRHLRLVNPVQYEPERLIWIAHDTQEIIEGIVHYDTLADACADCVRVAGYTARRRSAKRERVSPRECAGQLLGVAAEGPVALVFGREDRGLSNEQLDIAQVVATIPTTDHASLNLAQAVLIALYELHLAADDATRTLAPPRKDAPPSTSNDYEQFFGDALESLHAIDFLKTRNADQVMRTVRSLTFRAAPDAREISLIRAMVFEVRHALQRARKAAQSEPT